VLAETPGVEGNAITEMPFFTFLYGDLHAHMIDMPIMLLALAFLFHELVVTENDSRNQLARFLALVLGALAVAVTWMTNTWDWVTLLILCVLGLIYAWWIVWRRINRWSLLSFVGRIGGFVALNFLFLLPYTTWFATTSTSFTLWEGGKTPLWAYFDIHGLFLFLIVSLLAWDTARWFSQIKVRTLRGTWPLLLTGLIAFLLIMVGVGIAAAAGYQVALVVVPLVIWIGILFFRNDQSRAMQFVLVLAGLGLCLTLGVEIIVLGADIGRQNTVFKFYIQTWLLFSVAGGAAFAWLIQSCERWAGALRNIWFVLVSILIMLAAMYPVMATRGRAADRMGTNTPITLDGMEYMKHSRYGENEVWLELVNDYELIRWMQENIDGSPVIMEAQSAHEYLWGSRISIYTGLPSIIGWNFHQTQQHTFDPLPQLVRHRAANVNAFYIEPDIKTALDMIRWYDVGYIVVGGLERAYYPEDGLAKFDKMRELGMLELVYDEGEDENRTQLYRVNAAAIKGAAIAFLEDQGE
jgi:YYY domain-containing protein